MEILNHEWRWEHLYYIRTEQGIVKIRPRPDQQQILNLLYPAFFARQQTKVVILKNRQRGTSTLCSLFCEDCTAYYAPPRLVSSDCHHSCSFKICLSSARSLADNFARPS